MKFQLIGPVRFIAEGIETKDLASARQHILSVRHDLCVETRLPSAWIALRIFPRTKINNSRGDERQQQDERDQKPSFLSTASALITTNETISRVKALHSCLPDSATDPVDND